ncbi:MAG: glutathione S-transferase family protein [Myxococcota bacterium]|nr:glutathione S-transferase family protein [Myxococcota bacterium]MEE2779123.1 glutathione S-transferase family protein [Myxococcota bacterium]
MTRLHWYWSTNPQKVRWALEELEMPYELVKVDLGTGAQRSAGFTDISPRGKVPALEIDGAVLWDSNAILTYLGQREGRLWPSEPEDLARALNLLFMEASIFQDLAGAHFYQRVVKPFMGREPDLSSVERADRRIQPLYDVLEAHLERGPYLLGEFSLVDCSYGPWLPSLNLNERPRLKEWRDRLATRPARDRCEFTY